MKIAYTGWTWLIHHQDNQRYEFEQFLKEVADLGYDAENFAFITKYFENDAQAEGAAEQIRPGNGLPTITFLMIQKRTTRAVD